MARKRLPKDVDVGGGLYLSPPTSNTFISSGSVLLDCVLGGGYPLGRIVNIIGDKAVGKTLLAIEACANFMAKFPDGKIWYNESEAAFDPKYAAALGMPMPDGERVILLQDCLTVEDFFDDLKDRVDNLGDEPGLYILDSLDALSDRKEMSRDMDEGSYGVQKAKLLSQLFRRLSTQVGEKNVLILIISQIRDNIGVTFGKKTTRSGGRALDFYCTQIIELNQIGKEERTVKSIKRTIGVRVRAKCSKNKVGPPFRECEFPLTFGFGIDGLTADLEFLIDGGLEDSIPDLVWDSLGNSKHSGTKQALAAMRKKASNLGTVEYKKVLRSLDKAVVRVWRQIEEDFAPSRRKYE